MVRIPANASNTPEYLARLEAEVESVRQRLRKERAKTARKVRRSVTLGQASTCSRRSTGTTVLAPGYVATTRRGSIYATLLRTISEVGGLARQHVLFSNFQKNPSGRHARRLLNQIGVPAKKLERLIRSDQEYKAHCQKRTQLLRARAARGDARAKKALQNPARCSAGGQWKGNIAEAIDTLFAARSRSNLKRCKNIRILKRIHLMFDTIDRNGVRICFLYPEKNHASFLRAKKLAGHDC